MELTTKVDMARKGQMRLTHDDGVVLIGSCFADNVGEKLREAHFRCCVNPFGTLYNPMSVAEAIQWIVRSEELGVRSEELFCCAVACPDGNNSSLLTPHSSLNNSSLIWHSWMHHSRFSASSAEVLVDNINAAIAEGHEALKNAKLLIVTLGSAYVYRLAETGRIVANCHKQDERMFRRGRVSVSDIVDEWLPLIDELRTMNPQIRIMFTVSPIRHKRDGLHANQLSKATLLLAVDELCERRPDMCCYFPAYEIMMDELRDYRFYADDMVHPSSLAVEYIWQRFSDTFFDRKTQEEAERWRKVAKRERHRTIISEELGVRSEKLPSGHNAIAEPNHSSLLTPHS